MIDTNILVDFAAERKSYFESASKILDLCASEKIDGCIAAHSIMNAFYILRKDYSVDQRRQILKELCSFLSVINIDDIKILSSLDNFEFTDIEDCLQAECAKEFSADYIVTRNVKDFQNSMIKPILPDDFLKKFPEKS